MAAPICLLCIHCLFEDAGSRVVQFAVCAMFTPISEFPGEFRRKHIRMKSFATKLCRCHQKVMGGRRISLDAVGFGYFGRLGYYPRTPAHVRAHGPRTSAHVRASPRTSAHVRARPRTCPRTPAHVRAQPRMSRSGFAKPGGAVVF